MGNTGHSAKLRYSHVQPFIATLVKHQICISSFKTKQVLIFFLSNLVLPWKITFQWLSLSY